MKTLRFLLIACFFGASQQASADLNILNHIVGGAYTKTTETPWQVYIRIEKSNGHFYRCGGTVIAERWILSAAHCFIDSNNQDIDSTRHNVYPQVAADSIKVFSGNEDSDDAHPNSVLKLISHTSYDRNTKINDVALLELKNALPKPAQPIKLMDDAAQIDADYEFSQGETNNLLASGWGRTSSDRTTSTNILQRVVLNGIDDATCADNWKKPDILTNSALYICTNAIDKGTCNGDSGGPLVWQDPSHAGDPDKGYRLAGVTNFGSLEQCANNRLPDVFAQVSTLIPWIKASIKTSGTAYQSPEPVFNQDAFDIDYSRKAPIPTNHTPSNNSAGSFGLLTLVLSAMALFTRKKHYRTGK